MTAEEEPQGRPVDVDTGFWLWLTALPVLLVGYVVDLVVTEAGQLAFASAIGAVFAVVVATVVTTFLILMRHGYRWARTLLTAGGCTSAVYTVTSLFTVDRTAGVAVTYAISTIVGSVLIAGGMYLLHRPDSHGYFTR